GMLMQGGTKEAFSNHCRIAPGVEHSAGGPEAQDAILNQRTASLADRLNAELARGTTGAGHQPFCGTEVGSNEPRGGVGLEQPQPLKKKTGDVCAADWP